MKHIALDIVGRIFMVLAALLYPIFALVALPWAWLDSIGAFGFTTMESWKEGWKLYSFESLRSLWSALFQPIRGRP